MSDEENRNFAQRLRLSVAEGAKKSAGTSWFLLKIMVPVSFVVALLGWSGALAVIARWLSPLMGLLGLPGEAALVFISGALLNNYSAIAVMGGLALSMRDVTILAVMCLISHNLLVETTVMKKTGSSALKMALLRIGTALVAAFLLNLILPQSLADRPFSSASAASRLEFWQMFGSWAVSTFSMIVKIMLFVLAIMIVQRIFEEFHVMDFLSKLLAPLMKILGLPREASFLWIVINVVGYAYGAGIIVAECESGRMKKQDADLFNHHAAISHSIMEDTLLYLAISVPLVWLLVPRLVLSLAVVWLERGRRHFFRKSFRVGTM